MYCLTVLLGILSFLADPLHFVNRSFAFCDKPVASIEFPTQGQVIEEDFVTIKVKIPDQNNYNVEKVRIFIKGHTDQNSGWYNLEKGWKFTGQDWYYYDDLESSYKATWYFHGLPYQEYTITFQIQVKGCPLYVHDHVTFSQKSGPKPPIAKFDISSVLGHAPLTVNLFDQSEGTIDFRRWDFGDGNTSNDKNPSHTYANPGDYKVTLVVSGPGGTSLPVETTITVTKPPPVEQPPINPPPPVVSPPPITNPPTTWNSNFKLNAPQRVAGVINQDIPLNISVENGSVDFAEFDYDGDGATERRNYLPASVRYHVLGIFKQRLAVNPGNGPVQYADIEIGVFPETISSEFLSITDQFQICGKLEPFSNHSFYFVSNNNSDFNSAEFTLWKASQEDDVSLMVLKPDDTKFSGPRESIRVDNPEYGYWKVNIASGSAIKDGRFWVAVRLMEDENPAEPVMWVNRAPVSRKEGFGMATAGGSSDLYTDISSISIGTFSGKCSLSENISLCQRTDQIWLSAPVILGVSGTAVSGPVGTAGGAVLGLTVVGAKEITNLVVNSAVFGLSELSYRIFKDESSLSKAAQVLESQDIVADWAVFIAGIVTARLITKAIPKERLTVLMKKLIRLGFRTGMRIEKSAFEKAPVFTKYLERIRLYDFDEAEEALSVYHKSVLDKYAGDAGKANEEFSEIWISLMKALRAKIVGRNLNIYAKVKGRDALGNIIWDFKSSSLVPRPEYETLGEVDRIFKIQTPGGTEKFLFVFVKSNSSKIKMAQQLGEIDKLSNALRASDELKLAFSREEPEIIGLIFEEMLGKFFMTAHKPAVTSGLLPWPFNENLEVFIYADEDELTQVESFSAKSRSDGVLLELKIQKERETWGYCVLRGDPAIGFAFTDFNWRSYVPRSDKSKTYRYVDLDPNAPVSHYFAIQVDANGMILGVTDTVSTIRQTSVEITDDLGGSRDTRLSSLNVYPNPSNAEITFSLNELRNRDVFLTLYDARGAVIRTWILPASSENQKELLWDGRNQGGKNVSSGVYILKASSAKFRLSKKVVIIK